MRSALPILSLALFFSCNSESGHSYKEYQSVFVSKQFDKTVISKIQYYDSLKSLIFDHLDTLFSGDETQIYDIKTITTLHPGLSGQFQKIFLQIGRGNINNFTLSPDTTLTIVIRDTYDKSIDSYVTESLSSNRNTTDEKGTYPFLKDTLINKKWIYSIHVDTKNDI